MFIDEVSTDKSKNQLWKESGTSLTFKEWMDREVQKGTFVTKDVLDNSSATIKKITGLNEKPSPNINSDTILGLNKWVVLSSILVIGFAISYNVYKKNK